MGEKGEKGDAGGNVVEAKVSQMMVPVLSSTNIRNLKVCSWESIKF